MTAQMLQRQGQLPPASRAIRLIKGHIKLERRREISRLLDNITIERQLRPFLRPKPNRQPIDVTVQADANQRIDRIRPPIVSIDRLHY